MDAVSRSVLACWMTTHKALTAGHLKLLRGGDVAQSCGSRAPGRPCGGQSAPPAGLPAVVRNHQAAGPVPAPRTTPARRRPPQAKIAQRIIPHDLRPVVLRDELIELGDLFRAYQQRDEPDLALLADLQERKARAFTTWADATSEGPLRWEARRAEQSPPRHASSTSNAPAAPPAATRQPRPGC
ncbi:hypothetical protein [Streptomyces sp. NPDC060010]|uniref:hypothetical protein n=1 Tax=Streptomyces sp. NPDC060010 TaxID=3347036 RepID=UPI0036A26755